MHVPFCAAKCPYCDFYSFAADPGDADGFVDVLLREAELRAPQAPRTVFVGGGTPSWLAANDLSTLFDGLDRISGFRSSADEVTVECNPESLTAEKARRLRELGATRLSIGIQSLRPALLELFGRVHSVDDAFRALHAAQAQFGEAVSVDLIYAAPGQVLEEWIVDLDRILAEGLRHVSAYNLAFEDGTAFESWRASGRIRPLDEPAELAFFRGTREHLDRAGLEAYETSNFSSKGHHCRHNVGYWRNEPYVGLGPSAVSRVGRRRFGNARSLGAWRASVQDGLRVGSEGEWEETLSPRARLGETWWLGLRMTEGVDPQAARRTAGWHDPADPCLDEATALVSLGMLEQRGSRFALSPRGLPLADAVAARFLVPDG